MVYTLADMQTAAFAPSPKQCTRTTLAVAAAFIVHCDDDDHGDGDGS